MFYLALSGFLGSAYNLALLPALRAPDHLVQYRVQLHGRSDRGHSRVAGVVCALNRGERRCAEATYAQRRRSDLPVWTHLRAFRAWCSNVCRSTSGGRLAPMLVLVAQSGLIFGTWFPSAGTNPTEYAVVGMAALFTAVVRAPLTGIILAIALTGSFTLPSPHAGRPFASHASADPLIPSAVRSLDRLGVVRLISDRLSMRSSKLAHPEPVRRLCNPGNFHLMCRQVDEERRRHTSAVKKSVATVISEWRECVGNRTATGVRPRTLLPYEAAVRILNMSASMPSLAAPERLMLPSRSF